MVLDPWIDDGSDMNDSCTVYSITSDDSNHEVLRKNWRFWKYGRSKREDESNKDELEHEAVGKQVSSLVEIAARFVGRNLPFEQVELHQPPIADELQLRIAFLSFPESCREIYMYSCLANESNYAFNAGEQLYQDEEVVFNVLQIGFCLTASISKPLNGTFDVTILFDRGLITSCKCSCDAKNMWCAHCVAVCLFRIRKSDCVSMRPPISDSLSNLDRNQLRKFAQYLISENPKILPSAQLIIDKLTNKQDSVIKDVSGAPDVTAGPSISDNSVWCLDRVSIRYRINNVFFKFCVPTPMVCSDVIYLSNTNPIIVSERNCWLRALNNTDPEGIWNLLKIVRNMFTVKDRNAIQLLKIITEEMLTFEQIIIWWFLTKSNVNDVNQKTCTKVKTFVTQNSSAKICDEVVESWRLAVLNPALSSSEKDKIYKILISYQNSVKDTIFVSKFGNVCDEIYLVYEKPSGVKNPKKFPSGDSTKETFTFDGFKEALVACSFDWFKHVTISNLQIVRSHMPYVWDQTDPEDERFSKFLLSPRTSSFVYDDDLSVALLDRHLNELNLGSADADSFQRRCYRAEGLLAHGYKNQSYPLFAELAVELMENWHVLNDHFVETQRSSKNSKFYSGKNFISDCKITFVVKTIKLCYFFAKVLKKIAQYEMLAFKVALFGLEIPREPTQRKSLEVWFSLQESEILTFLNGFQMNDEKVVWLLKKAASIQVGELHRDPVLLVNLVHFIFETLVEKNTGVPLTADHEEVVFSIAVDALDMKKGASEVDHPLLAENIRMQRKNLILKMIYHYVNKPARLLRVMSKLLNDNIHQYKCFKLRESYYSDNQSPQSDTSILFKTKIQQYRSQHRAPQDCADFDFFSIFPIVNIASLQQNASNRYKLSKKNPNKNRNKVGSPSSSVAAGSTAILETNVACSSSAAALTLSPHNRPSENLAFYYADLSKAIFSKARDGYDDFNHVLSFIRHEQINYAGNKNNISLFMCALQLYMYSLSINNWHSSNWYFRNYSSQAITISNIAIEHGTPAIAFITDYWHSHLSPSEALTIAETGFRCNRDDDLTKENVSVLALSVLSHCEWLTVEQVDKALSFCKLFSLDYLEYGCLIVESASLQFASKSHAITSSAAAGANYGKNKTTTAGNSSSHNSHDAGDGGNDSSGDASYHSCENSNVSSTTDSGNSKPNSFNGSKNASSSYLKARTMFRVARYWFDLYWSINPKPTYTDYNLRELFNCDPETDQTIFNQSYPMINIGNFYSGSDLTEIQKLYIRSFYSSIYHPTLYPVFVPNQPHSNYCLFDSLDFVSALTETQLRIEQNDEMAEKRQFYLLSVHRVGLIALDFLAKSNDSSKSYKYFTQVPTYSISIIWHLRVAKYLGGIYLQQFCNTVLNSISNPYLLYDVCCEAAFYYSGMDNDLFLRHLGSTFLPLVRKCQQNFMVYLDYKFNGKCAVDEFYGVFKAAYSAMALTPGHFHLLWNCVTKAKRKVPPTPNFWAQFDDKIIRESTRG